MKSEVHQDEWGIQIVTSDEEKDHIIEVNDISELVEVSLAINIFLDNYYNREKK